MNDDKIRTGVPFPVTPNPECPEFDMCQFLHLAMSEEEMEEQAVDIEGRVIEKIGNAQPKLLTLSEIQALTTNVGLVVEYLGTETKNIWKFENGGYVDSGVLYSQTTIADGSITPNKTNFFTKSTNILDISTITEKTLLSIYNETSPNNNFSLSDYIPVEPKTTISSQKDGVIQALMTYIVAFGSAKNHLFDASVGSESSTYVVPDDVHFIRISFYGYGTKESLKTNKIAINVSDVNIPYMPFDAPELLQNERLDANYIKEITSNNIPEYLNKNKVNINQLDMASSRNLFNKDGKITSGFIYNGEINASDTLSTSDFIEVKPSTYYSFVQQESVTEYARFTCEFDENKNYIKGTSYNTPETASVVLTNSKTKYIRFSFYNDDLKNTFVKEGKLGGFFTPYRKQIEGNYLDKANNLIVFLPKDIYCAVGRTIEIYNKQVLINAKKYNFRWRCPVGGAFERKYSIKGTNENIGDYKLELGIYDDDLNCIYYDFATLHIVPNTINAPLKLLPIGDSLTALGETWQLELNKLSNNITTIGTRGNLAKNEGRSGWTTEFYINLAKDTGTGVVNAFYNPTTQTFDYAYYKQQNNMNPDVINILLGTNDLLNYSKEEFVGYIKQMLDSIRANDKNIPIMLCYTITWGNQNGIGVEGDIRTAAGRFKYNLDKTVIEGVKLLYEFINEQNYGNIYFTPLTQCHDSEYNFGAVETPVNPRATQTELMPIEAVHPQKQGWEQMADVIFSELCYIKNK